MRNNKVIEDDIIEYYSDFHGLHTLKEDFQGFTLYGDYDLRLCSQIESIVYEDLIKQSKTDLIHYILEEVSKNIDWNYITGSLQDWYFSEPENEVE